MLLDRHTRTPAILLKTDVAELNGVASPDGRWLAYQANPSGTFEIYVRPLSDVDKAVSLVSSGGGTRPRWSRDGRELFYVSADGALTEVAVTPGARWSASAPRTVVGKRYLDLGVNASAGYDVTADGQRFLMIDADGETEPGSLARLAIVLNWQQELARLIPRR